MESSPSRRSAAGQQTDSSRVHVGRDHEAVVVHPFRTRTCLAAGCGRDVEHTLARLRIERGDDRLARLVLRSGAALPYRRERADVATAWHDERVGDERAPFHAEPEVEQLLFDLGDRRAQRVHAQGERGGFVVHGERRERVGDAEVVDEQLHDPVRMRRAHRDAGHGVGRRPRPRRARTRQRPEHTVDEAAQRAS